LSESPITITAHLGRPFFAGWRFDDPWEVEPGRWKIELWLGTSKLAAQEFTVVKP